MLEDDVATTTKRTVANTSNVGCYNESKGKRNRDDQERSGKRDSKELRQFGHRSAVEGSKGLSFRESKAGQWCRVDLVHGDAFATPPPHLVPPRV